MPDARYRHGCLYALPCPALIPRPSAHFNSSCLGGGKRCDEPCCEKSANVGGRCRLHGGGKLCDMKGCDKALWKEGRCYAHRDVEKECSESGCDKKARALGLCPQHGGGGGLLPPTFGLGAPVPPPVVPPPQSGAVAEGVAPGVGSKRAHDEAVGVGVEVVAAPPPTIHQLVTPAVPTGEEPLRKKPLTTVV